MKNVLFSLLGKVIQIGRKGGTIKDGYQPYADDACNYLYNALFCDKIAMMRKRGSAGSDAVWTTVLAKQPYADALRPIADDPAQDSRARLLAYARMRELLQPVPTGRVLGTVIELSVNGGLDVLAAYADGHVAYINHKETITAFEPVPKAIMPKVRKLLSAAQGVVERIGPWFEPRIAPPGVDMIRMSFLVSDGLYFGQGPMAVMERDAVAKPVIAAALELVKAVTSASGATDANNATKS